MELGVIVPAVAEGGVGEEDWVKACPGVGDAEVGDEH